MKSFQTPKLISYSLDQTPHNESMNLRIYKFAFVRESKKSKYLFIFTKRPDLLFFKNKQNNFREKKSGLGVWSDKQVTIRLNNWSIGTKTGQTTTNRGVLARRVTGVGKRAKYTSKQNDLWRSKLSDLCWCEMGQFCNHGVGWV